MKRIAAALLLTSVLIAAPAAIADDEIGGGDIACGCEGVRMWLPSSCADIKNSDLCTGGLGCLTPCAIDPHCPALKFANEAVNQDFRILYNQAVFGRFLMMPLSEARRALVAFIIDNILRPDVTSPFQLGSTDFDIIITDIVPMNVNEICGGTTPEIALEPGSKVVTQACLNYDPEMPGPSNRPKLVVSNTAFTKSPAYLASAIGHELIHYWQKKDLKSYTGAGTYAQTVQHTVYELEAYMYQSGTDCIEWPIKRRNWTECMYWGEVDKLKNAIEAHERTAAAAFKQFGTVSPDIGDWLKMREWPMTRYKEGKWYAKLDHGGGRKVTDVCRDKETAVEKIPVKSRRERH